MTNSTDIKISILEFLKNENAGFISFHNHVIKNFSKRHPKEVGVALREMSNDGLVSISGDYGTLGASYAGVVQDLSTLNVSGKITDKGLEYLKDNMPKSEIKEAEEEGNTKNKNPKKKESGK